MKKYLHACDGYDVHVVVFVEPDPPWVSRVVVRAERIDAGATVPAWSRQLTVRALDSWSAAAPGRQDPGDLPCRWCGFACDHMKTQRMSAESFY
jgi:hypothetical protein